MPRVVWMGASGCSGWGAFVGPSLAGTGLAALAEAATSPGVFYRRALDSPGDSARSECPVRCRPIQSPPRKCLSSQRLVALRNSRRIPFSELKDYIKRLPFR